MNLAIKPQLPQSVSKTMQSLCTELSTSFVDKIGGYPGHGDLVAGRFFPTSNRGIVTHSRRLDVADFVYR